MVAPRPLLSTLIPVAPAVIAAAVTFTLEPTPALFTPLSASTPSPEAVIGAVAVTVTAPVPLLCAWTPGPPVMVRGAWVATVTSVAPTPLAKA